jgi:hypothetical protein
MRRKFIFAAILALVMQIGIPTVVSTAASTGMTSVQIKAMEKSLAEAFVNSFRTMRSTSSCNPNTGVCLLKFDFDNYTTCKAGGSIHTIGHWSGIVSTQAITNIGGNLKQPIFDWRCITGWYVNADPVMSYAGHISMFGGKLEVSLTQSGAWRGTSAKGTLPKKTQSCRITASQTYSPQSGGIATVHTLCVRGTTYNFSMHF